MGVNNHKVYTPFKYANEITREGFRNYFKKDYSFEKLNKVKVIDLSSGTGNLLCVALEKLIRLSKKVSGNYYYLPSWIIAYDIDETALEEYRINIENILKKYNLSGEILIQNKDSLKANIEDKYNIVLGNPPYIGEKNNKDIFEAIKNTPFGRKYYQGKMDYFYYFIQKGIDILEEDGTLVYIVTNYWLRADSGKLLREKIKGEGEFVYINNINTSVFEDAEGQHNIIFAWEKNGLKNREVIIKNYNLCEEALYEDKKTVEMIEEIFTLKNSELYDKNGNIILTSKKNKKILERIKEKGNYLLGDLLNINQGIISGGDKAFITTSYIDELGSYLKPLYKSKDISYYTPKEKNDYWILYLDRNTNEDEKLINHLEEYKEKLKNRREVKNGKINWWELQWPREKKIFEEEKIVARQRCKTNIFAYTKNNFYGSADIYYLTKKEERNLFNGHINLNFYYLLGFLNSSIFYKWYRYMGKSKGYNLEFYSTPLKEVPIYYPDNLDEVEDIIFLIKDQIENYTKERQRLIDDKFLKLYNL